MGIPYIIDLAGILATLESTLLSPIPNKLLSTVSSYSHLPLLTVGSGGSFSGVSSVSKLHETITGKMPVAITPQELYLSKVDSSNMAILFLTASGNNKDIIRSLEVAIKREYKSINIICANINSKIVQVAK